MDYTWLAGLDPDTVKPGLLGLVVVLALAVATAVLLRSFTRQLKKIDLPEESERPPDQEDLPPGSLDPRPGGQDTGPGRAGPASDPPR
ncbi:MAG TPA: hypothetical protein VK365_05850 [Nocardioidaceae bacterium]|jgi:hypothetical protein|nr:hypothetical protein [Nocardioidaceae bacterium]